MKLRSTSRPAEQTLGFGEWSSLRYHLILAYDGPVPAGTRRGTFSNENEVCWLLRRGTVRLESAAGTVTAGPGRWVLVGRSVRRQVFSADAEVLSLHFKLTWPGGEPVLRQDAPRVIQAREHPKLERTAVPLTRRLGELMPQAGLALPGMPCSLKRYFQIQNLLPVWLAAYVEMQEQLGNFPCRPGMFDERVMRVAAALDREPLDGGFPEAVTRKSAGVGRSQINGLFTRALGMTPRKYFEDRRREEARSQLRHTRRSVKQVAFALGFRHESHFSLWFKRQEGVSPAAWRLRE
jgi:AraC-like DNA-binding protein